MSELNCCVCVCVCVACVSVSMPVKKVYNINLWKLFTNVLSINRRICVYNSKVWGLEVIQAKSPWAKL